MRIALTACRLKKTTSHVAWHGFKEVAKSQYSSEVELHYPKNVIVEQKYARHIRLFINADQ